MNDDPTQLFPEPLWKRYATEPVCVPSRNVGRIVPKVVTAVELGVAALPAKDAQKLTKLPARPLLN